MTTASKQQLISMGKLSKVFFTDDVETHALTNIDLNVYKGDYISISGPSGCGKSTLLSIMGLLDVPTTGSYFLGGTDVSALSESERARLRNREIGFIFQAFNLISDLNVFENVEMPLTYRSDISKAQRKALVIDALEKVDMGHRQKHYPSQLSGGQQQRVAIARALATNPSILLVDEPTGNLDSKNAEMVMSLLDKLHQNGATICMVTHDPRSAMYAQRSIEIMDGVIAAEETNLTTPAVVA